MFVTQALGYLPKLPASALVQSSMLDTAFFLGVGNYSFPVLSLMVGRLQGNLHSEIKFWGDLAPQPFTVL